MNSHIFDGFVKAAKVNFMDLYKFKSGATSVAKDLKPKLGGGVNVAQKAGTELSAHAKEALKGSNVASMGKSEWHKTMGLA